MECVRPARPIHRALRAYRQRGTSIVEAVIALPILLVVILGAIQFALIYEAKATLNHASLQAARLGAVRNADPDAIRRGLARGLAPLYSPESSLSGLMSTINRIETELAVDARIRILNPTREAFDDFGEDVDGRREIPNDRLHTRSTAVGPRSGVNIQDANLLRVEITYGYELHVPLVNWFIARVLLGVRSDADGFEQQLLRRTRLPIIATATVRMQSPARLSDAVVSVSDFPELERIPSGSVPPRASEDEQDETERDEHDDPHSPDEEDDDDGSSLSDGFFGFGEGSYENPAGGGSGGGEGNWWNNDTGGGLNGGNPQQCLIDEPSSPFPFGASANIASIGVELTPDVLGSSTGSSATLSAVSLASLSVGNPIHVVTGNKFQQETDIAPFPGRLGLEFRRYYNSSAVHGRSVLGAGWRHSYQASLRHVDDGLHIVQADGRLVRFDPAGKAGQFIAQRVGDGAVVVEGDIYKWLTPDGRELSFERAGRLLRIEAPGASLVLRYDDRGELQRVEDSQGRKLYFEYYPNGRLASVRGPGTVVRYAYDAVGNLELAAASDGSARRYAYTDARHPHHLTGISVGNVRLRAYGKRSTYERIASWAYDEQGRAIYSSHPVDAGKVSLEFNEGYTDVIDAFGRKTRYITGWRGGVAYVSEVRGPGCGVCGTGDARYRYDDLLRLVEYSRVNDPTLRYTYDERGRLVRVEREVEGRREWLVRYSYDGESYRISRIERPSVKPNAVAAIELTYSDGLIVNRRESGFTPTPSGYAPIRREVAYEYDEEKRLRRIDGPRPDVQDWIDLSYDDASHLVRIDSPYGEIRVLSYDRAGRPLHIERRGRPGLKLRYDAHGRIAAIAQLRSSGPLEYTYEYDDAGRLVQIVDADGRRIRYGYDAAGRPNRLTRSDSWITTFARYAPDDRIERLFAVGPEGKLLKTLYFAYDEHRRLIEVRDGQGAPLQQFVHLDADALPDRRIDPLGHETLFSYDSLGQLASVQAADGGVTQVERDEFGRVTAVVAPNGARTTYSYDDFGRRVGESSADRGELRFVYDAADNLIERTDARGATIRLAYDAANRLVRVDRKEGTTKLEYANGLLTTVHGEKVIERYRYDADAQLIAHTRTVGGHEFTTRFEYDGRGRLTIRRLPSGVSLRYRYDSNGKLQSIVQERLLGDRAIANAESKLAHRLDALHPFTYGNGLSAQTEFDARFGNVSRRKIEQVTSIDYDYDASGRLTRIKQGEQERMFQYDGVGRLVRAILPAKQIEFQYDLNGNRTALAVDESSPSCDAGGSCEAQDSNSRYRYAQRSNRLVAVDDKEYVYNEAGLAISIGDRRYEYDSNGRPTRIYEGGELVAEYEYNFWGERVRKRVHSTDRRGSTIYIYEQNKLVAEADERGRVTREYVYLGHHPVALIEGGRTYWIHTDHLGAPIAVTDEGRRVIWRSELQPFGEARVDPDPDGDGKLFTLNLRFPGQYADDETGTHYNYFRDYDPATGRYLTADPIGLMGGINSFAYVSNAPLQRMDTLGLYDQMVHYYITYFLGLVAGLPQDVARMIAIATQYVDENWPTEPAHVGVYPNNVALPLYHFVLDYNSGAYGDKNSDPLTRFYSPESAQLENLLASTDPARLRDLWVQTHPSPIPNTCSIPSFEDINRARYQLFGEFLHAFEDTFAHRDAYNMPYAIAPNSANTPVALVGHAGPGVPDTFGHAPDRTYNQNYASPSRCHYVARNGRTVVVQNLSRAQCEARNGRYEPAVDDDTPECEVRYVLGGTSVERGVTEAQCAELGRLPTVIGVTYRPGSGQIWAFNELRTLRMEYEVFDLISKHFADEIAANGGPRFTWADIAGLPDWDESNPEANARIGLEQGFEDWAASRGFSRQKDIGSVYNASVVLQQFNSSRAPEPERVKVLNDWLKANGFVDGAGNPLEIELWENVSNQGRRLRSRNLDWIPADSFPGTLLPRD